MRTPADLPDPVTSVEGFAELSALLADPFADRPAILSAAGLDAERWQKTQDDWAKRIRDSGTVAERFAEVFDKALRAVTAPAAPLPQSRTVVVASAAEPAHPFAATVDVNPGAMRPAVPSRHPSSPPNPLADTLESPTRLPVPVLPLKKC